MKKIICRSLVWAINKVWMPMNRVKGGDDEKTDKHMKEEKDCKWATKGSMQCYRI
jgi:hypothetical protein